MNSPYGHEVSNTMTTKHQSIKKVKAPRRDRVETFHSFGDPIPKFADITFRYVDRINLDPGSSGAVAQYFYSANGMYDPDITGTGHQPLGFDQWIPTFYNHYCVYKSEISVTFYSQIGDATGQTIAFLGLSDDTTTAATFTPMIENPSYKHKFVGSIGSGHDVTTLKHSCNLPTQFGMTKEAYLSSDNKRGTSTGNPTEQSYYNICLSGNNITVNPNNVSALVQIIYHARLSERSEIQQS